MVDDEQITVADGVGTVFRLALAVSVAGMAGDTAVAYPCWTKTFTGCYIEGVEMFEEVFKELSNWPFRWFPVLRRGTIPRH